MDQEGFFDSLVRNGLDFLRKAIDELEENPKYSVIHFFAAVEIFLKSRLLLEHWALVHVEPQHANIQRFSQGKFRSVGLDEAINRLVNTLNTPLSSETIKNLKRLQDHRNKLIHFFHPEYGPHADPSVIATVVAEECRAWIDLQRMLTQLWSEEYAEYQQDIETLNDHMRRLRPFLRVTYDSLRADIEKGKERGVRFVECISCGFEASKEVEIIGPVYETKCLVCDYEIQRLDVPCPNCGNTIEVYELGEGTCEECGLSIDMGYLIEYFGDQQGPEEELISPSHAYCPNCEWVEMPTVVPYNSRYFCLNCFAVYDEVSHCEWCAELNAGDMTESIIYGCVLCEGGIRWRN